MTDVVRPLAKLLAVELSGIEVDKVSGGELYAELSVGTDFYCGPKLDTYDGSKPD